MTPGGLNRGADRVDTSSVHQEPVELRPMPRLDPGRRAADRTVRVWAGTRDLLLDALQAPLRSHPRAVAGLAALVALAELVGFAARQTCRAGCGPTAQTYATRLDMDALGSVPRLLVTGVLAAVALACAVAVRRAGRHGAAVWWAVLTGGTGVLAAAKYSSLHSLVEVRLAGLLPETDVQLLFVVVSLVGLLVVVVSGRWVRRETITTVTTWLALYAVASVGLAAVTNVLAVLGPLALDVSTLVEETGEGLAAVGLLAVVVQQTRELAARR